MSAYCEDCGTWFVRLCPSCGQHGQPPDEDEKQKAWECCPDEDADLDLFLAGFRSDPQEADDTMPKPKVRLISFVSLAEAARRLRLTQDEARAFAEGEQIQLYQCRGEIYLDDDDVQVLKTLQELLPARKGKK